MALYPSQAWCDEWKKAINDDQKVAETGKNWGVDFNGNWLFEIAPGGGLEENLARIMPPGVQASIEPDSWSVPAVFPWLQRLGGVDDEEMARVFNMGVGLVLVVSSYYAENIRRLLEDCGLESWRIGRVAEASVS